MRFAQIALLFCAVAVVGCAMQKRDATDLIQVELSKQSCAERRVTLHKTEPDMVADDTLAIMTLEVPKDEKDEMFADGRSAFEAGEENRFAKFSLDLSCKQP